jgi:hypothetical protein
MDTHGIISKACEIVYRLVPDITVAERFQISKAVSEAVKEGTRLAEEVKRTKYMPVRLR